MGTPDQCVKAVQTLNGTELKGKVITVEVVSNKHCISKLSVQQFLLVSVNNQLLHFVFPQPKSTPFVGKGVQKTDNKPKSEPDKTASTPNTVKATPTNNTSNNTGTPKTSKTPASNEKDLKGSKQGSRQNNTTPKCKQLLFYVIFQQ